MVEKIKTIKDTMLKRMEQAIDEKGPERVNVQEMGLLADIVKDLAEAEKECWEAEYYQSVTDAMDRSGYMPEGVHDSQYRSGYNPNRDSMGRYSRRRGYRYGYDHDPIQGVREAMTGASPEDREKMQRELRQMLGM